MPKGEIVGKYVTDGEWHEECTKDCKHIYRQCILVIDGKYSCGCGDSLNTTAMSSNATIIRRRRFSDHWIPFKFPERTRVIRSE
jgi:hypothetical protein